jgi:hypothetical protein
MEKRTREEKKSRDRFESLSKVEGIIYAKGAVVHPVRNCRVQKLLSFRPVQIPSLHFPFPSRSIP